MCARLIALAVVALLAGGCREGAPQPPEATSVELPGVLVEAEWLRTHRGSAELQLIDARTRDAYRAGHIPGAVSLPASSLDDSSGNLASVSTIEGILSQAGVRMDRLVVIYDEAVDHRPAARLLWALEVHGHRRVAVLNGGLPTWRKAAPGSLETTPSRLAPSRFVAHLRPDRIATRLQVLRASSNRESLLLDARSLPEYIGKQSSGPRAGHISGAHHHDANSNLEIDTSTGQCSMRDVHTLQSIYADLPRDRQIISYCNSGKRASVAYLALRALGFDVAVYDGGWLEWSSHPDLPIDVGDSQ